MTTVAYKNGIIAADTKSFCGHEVSPGHSVKIARNNVGHVIGFCGVRAAGEKLIREFLAGSPVDWRNMPKEESAVIVSREGELTHYDSYGDCRLYVPYYAIGSGSAVALGALHAGATAIAAVRAAIEHDDSSAGEAVHIIEGIRSAMWTEILPAI